MNRFKFTKDNVDTIKAYLKTGAGRKPNILSKFPGEIKKNKLYIDGKVVVMKKDVEKFLRKKIYDGKTPLTRDAAYFWLSKHVAGISRKDVDNFLKKQRSIRETDNQQPSTKRKPNRVNTKGRLHIDLVEITFKDLPFDPIIPKNKRLWKTLTDEEKAEGEDVNDKHGYFFGCVDSITSLSFYQFSNFKNYKYITPIAKECFEWFSKKLGIPMSKLTLKSDAGSEFDWNRYTKWGIRSFIVKSDPFIEGKNSHFQRVLYRIAKMKKTRNLDKLCNLAMIQLNRTVSSVSGDIPIINADRGTKELSEKYNSKRGKGTGVKVKLKPLVPGKDQVRIQLKFKKDKEHHKAYHGDLWSKRVYAVKSKKGDRYVVNKKLRHRDELKLTAVYDKESEEIVRERSKH